MKHFILAGSEAVIHFQNENWAELQSAVLTDNAGDIYEFDPLENNSLSELLEQLKGWHDFIELSESDIKDIEENTTIEFLKEVNIKHSIVWCTNDFEAKAESNFQELKKDNPEEYAHIENWEQLYDKTQFPQQLERMISGHDATIGITWLTVEEYLGNCEIR